MCYAIQLAEFLARLAEQMRKTLDSGISPLPFIGARGILFRVVLLEFGYTFVAKGTRSGLIPHLHHEADVYARLQPLQGIHVPVCLGTLDLRSVGRRYYYDITTTIVFFVFLSYAGSDLHHVALDSGVKKGERPELGTDVPAILRRLCALGVLHNDIGAENTLWDEKTGSVMLIDFERAELLPMPSSPVRTGRPYPGEMADRQDRRKVRKLEAKAGTEERPATAS